MQEQTLPCSICGTVTFMLGTKLCDRCWNLDRYFDSLQREKPQALEAWLKTRGFVIETHP